MDAAAVGATLRRVREARAYDEATAARGAEVAEAALQRFEAGEPALSTAAIARLAAFLDVDLDRVLDGCWQPSVAFKALGTTTDFFDADRLHLERALDIAGQVAELRWALGLESPLSALSVPAEVAGTPYLDGYSRARDVRRVLAFGATEPADPMAMLEDRLFVPVVFARLRTQRIAAIAVKDTRSATAAVIVNTSAERSANARLLATDLAHELSHVMFDEVGADIAAWFDVSGYDVDGDDDRREQRARAFAAEVIVPGAGLRELFGAPKEVTDPDRAVELVRSACEQFQSPSDLTAYHLMNHGYIDRAVRARARDGAAAQIASLPAAPRTSLLSRLVTQAMASGVITAARGRALLGRSVWE